MLRALVLFACFALCACRSDEPSEGSPIDDWARMIAETASPRWLGPRVVLAPSVPRPSSFGTVLSSLYEPVSVSSDSEVPIELAHRALRELERAARAMRERGYDEPWPDGRGADGFDLYLRQRSVEGPIGNFDHPAPALLEAGDVPARRIRVGYDVPVLGAGLDGVTSFAELDVHRLAPVDFASCVFDAYVQALLASQDPAEAPSIRRALGAFLAFRATGRMACAEAGLARAQARPELGMLSHAPGSGELGALLLDRVSARHDGGGGDFVRDLWQGARQWTWEGQGLRAEPDFLLALDHFLSVSGDPLERVIEEVAVERYLAGDRATAGTLARWIPAVVPRRVLSVPLPIRAFSGSVELGTLGSAYGIMDVRPIARDVPLRVWLRGEFGVSWSLVCVRLDGEGRELGRIRTPVRDEPRAYVPVELDSETESVLFIVTNVGGERLDADEPDESVHGFILTVDQAEDGPLD